MNNKHENPNEPSAHSEYITRRRKYDDMSYAEFDAIFQSRRTEAHAGLASCAEGAEKKYLLTVLERMGAVEVANQWDARDEARSLEKKLVDQVDDQWDARDEARSLEEKIAEQARVGRVYADLWGMLDMMAFLCGHWR